jgi:hypothetical protein
MKRKRFTEEQIIGILKEHDLGAKTADLCRKHGISEATFYNWKSKFGWHGCVGSQAAEAAPGREWQAEKAAGRCHARQRRPEGSAVKKMVTPAVKREAKELGLRDSVLRRWVELRGAGREPTAAARRPTTQAPLPSADHAAEISRAAVRSLAAGASGPTASAART